MENHPGRVFEIGIYQDFQKLKIKKLEKKNKKKIAFKQKYKYFEEEFLK